MLLQCLDLTFTFFSKCDVSFFSCKVCGQVFADHMMGKPQIRSHLFNHFREKIHNMVIKVDNDKYKCPRCDFEEPNMNKFCIHLGILHRMLDTCWAEHESSTKKKMSLADYKKKYNSSPPQLEHTPKQELGEQTAQVPQKDLSSCPICDKWDSREAIKIHAVEHFVDELTARRKNPWTACAGCQPHGNAEYFMLHTALDHGWLEQLLKDPRLVDKKREELVSNR
jgi:hypothetical protein